MSDFQAQVKAVLDPSSLSTLQSQIKNALENQSINIKINGVNFNNLIQQAHKAGQQVGQHLSNNIANALKNINVNNGLGSISNMNRMLKSAGLDHNSISMVTHDLEKMLVTINKISTTQSKNGNIKMTISGLDEFDRAIQVVKVFDRENDRINTSTKSITQSFATAADSAKLYTEEVNEATKQQRLLTNASTLSNNMEAWLNNNKKAAKEYGDQIRNLQEQLKNPNLTGAQYQQVSAEFRKIQSEAKAVGLSVSQFAMSMKNAITTALGIGSVYQAFNTAIKTIKGGVSDIVSLDTALVDLQKTTSATTSQLNDFYYKANDIAKSLGSTTKEVIQAAADWSRLGYAIEDAQTMARTSSIFASISPGMDIEKATDGLVSAMKAFKIDAFDALDEIASKINIIGNTQAVSNIDIVEILTRSSAAMDAANNTLDQTIALGTAATEITRNASLVGTALRTISMRIRGYDEETEEFVGGIEQLSGAIADLTKTAESPGGISLFTDETKETYKSTYQLLADISKIYDELTDKQQAQLLETLGGKRGGQVIASILSNFETVESSIKSMSNSAGNAMQEMGIIEESLEFKLNALREAGVGIWQSLIDRDSLGALIDFGTNILEIFDGIIQSVGVLAPALAGISIAAFVKNFEKLKEIGHITKAFKEVASAGQDIKRIQNAIMGLSEANQIAVVSSTTLTAAQQATILSNNGLTSSVIAASLAQQGFTKEQVEGALAAAGFSDAEIKATIATTSFETASLGLGTALKGLWSTLLAHPFMLAAAAAAVCIGVFSKLASASVDASKAADEAFQKSKDSLTEVQNEAHSLDELIKRYEELGNSGKQDAETREEIASIQKEIVNLVGNQAGGLDLVNGNLKEELSKLKDISTEMQNQVRTAANLAYLNSEKSAEKAIGNKEYLGIFKGLDYVGKVTDEERQALGIYGDLFQGAFGTYGLNLETFNGTPLGGSKEKASLARTMMGLLENNLENWRNSDLYLGLDAVATYYEKYAESTHQAASYLLDSAIYTELAGDKYKSVATDTADSFNDLKENLVDVIEGDADIQNAIANGALTLNDIEQAVINQLASDPARSKGYEEYKKKYDEETSAFINEMQKRYAELKDKLQNQDISDWFDTLSDSNKEIVYDIYMNADDGSFDTLESIQARLKAINQASDITSRNLTSFDALIGDAGDNSFSEIVNNYTKKISSLRSALDNLSAGKLTSDGSIELAMNFPELAPYINDTDKLKEKILELIESSGLEMDDFLDYIIEVTPEATNEVNALRKALLSLADVSTTPEKYKELLGILDGFGPASQSASEALNKLNNALQTGSYGAGLEARADNYLKMLEKYQQGEIGDSDFRAYAEYFGIDLIDHIDENGQKIYKTYDQIGDEIERVSRYAGAYWDDQNNKWATDADLGMKNWLDDISEMENELISFDQETKTLHFDPELLFNSDKLSEIAQQFGITSEFFIDLLNNFRKFSLDIGDYTNEELESALKTAELYDGTILDPKKIEEALSALGYSSEVIQEIVDRAKQLSDTDIELSYSEESINNYGKALSETYDKIHQMQQAGLSEGEQVQHLTTMLEGLDPEIQAKVIAKLKEDPVLGSLAEQAEEAIGDQEVPVKTEAEALTDAAESVENAGKNAADFLSEVADKWRSVFSDVFKSIFPESSTENVDPRYSLKEKQLDPSTIKKVAESQSALNFWETFFPNAADDFSIWLSNIVSGGDPDSLMGVANQIWDALFPTEQQEGRTFVKWLTDISSGTEEGIGTAFKDIFHNIWNSLFPTDVQEKGYTFEDWLSSIVGDEGIDYDAALVGVAKNIWNALFPDAPTGENGEDSFTTWISKITSGDISGALSDVANNIFHALFPDSSQNITEWVTSTLSKIKHAVSNFFAGGTPDDGRTIVPQQTEWVGGEDYAPTQSTQYIEGDASTYEVYATVGNKEELKSETEETVESAEPTVTIDTEVDTEEAEDKLTKLGNKFNEVTNGNIDYNKRPHVSPQAMWDAGYSEFDGDVATLYSSGHTVDAVKYPITFEITPITEDGKVLTQEEVDNYIDSLDLTGGLEEFLASDAEGLNLIMHAVEGEYDESFWNYFNDQLSKIKDLYEQTYAETVGYNWESEIEEPEVTSKSIEFVAEVEKDEVTEFTNEVESNDVIMPITPEITETTGSDIPLDTSEEGIEIDNTNALDSIDEVSDSFSDFADYIENRDLSIGGEDGIVTERFVETLRGLSEDPETTIEVPLDANVADLMQSLIDGKVEVEGWSQEMSTALANAFPDQLTLPTIDTAPFDNATTAANNLADAEANVTNQAVDESADVGQVQNLTGALDEGTKSAQGMAQAESEVSAVPVDMSSQVAQVRTARDAANETADAFYRAADAILNYNNTPVSAKNAGATKLAKGTKSAKGGLTLLGDEFTATGEPRPELVVSDGEAYIAGLNGPTFTNLKKGDVVYPYKETKKILENHKFDGNLRNAIPAFSNTQTNRHGSVDAGSWEKFEEKLPTSSSKPSQSGNITYNDYSTNYDVDFEGDSSVASASDLSSFTSLIKSEDFEKFVDDFLNATEQLQTAFDNLADGADGAEVFDTLYDHFKEDAEALEVLGERYDFTADKVKALNDLVRSRVIENFNSQFGNLETEQDIAALQDYMNTILEMGKVTETILNLDTFSDKMSALYSAIKESVDATGLTADSIAELQERYKNLEGFNPDVLFERTYNGIHLNTKALRELETEYQQTTRSKINKHLKDLETEYARLTKEIESCNEEMGEAEKAELYAQRGDIQDQIEDVKTLASQYDGLTSAFEKWKQAQSMGEEGDLYDDLAGSLEEINELYEKGLIGTNKFRSAVQLMTNMDLSNMSAYEIAKIYEESLPVMQKYFTEGGEGIEQFLKDVNSLNSAWASVDSSGNWMFNFDDKEVANAMGINVETVQALLKKMSDFGFDVKLDIDTTAVEEFEEHDEESDGIVVWDNDTYAVDKYIDAKHETEGTVHWKNDTSDIPDGSSGESGTSEAGGTAYAGGNWGIKGSGTALVGELGAELLVRRGKYYVIGANGAEFFDYRDGDIIFDAEQTKQLLKGHGKLTSGKRRGTSFLMGSAFSSGGGHIHTSISKKNVDLNTAIHSGGSNGGSGSSGSEVSYEDFDWIEIAVKRVTEAIDRLKSIASSTFKTLKERLTASSKEANKLRSEIELQEKAYARYMKQADSVELSEALKKRVREGAVDINSYDDATRELIQKYQDWYEKAINCKDAIDDLHESLSSLYQERFDQIQEDYNNQLGIYEAKIKALEGSSYQTVSTNNGNIASTTTLLTEEISVMARQLTDMNAAFNEAINSGSIKMYSEAWYKMNSEIDGVKQNIIDAYNDIAKAYEDTFNNIESYYSDQKGLFDDELESYENSNYYTAARNNQFNTKQIGVYRKEIGLAQKELKELYAARDNAVNSGAIVKGSEAWVKMTSSINEITNSITKAHHDIAASFESTFENIETHYSHYLNNLNNLVSSYNNAIELNTAKGFLSSTKYYDDLSKIESKNIDTLKKELQSLETAMDSAMKSGEIEQYSESWWSMQESIDGVKSSLEEANIQLVEYANTMRELQWSYFDLLQSKIEELNEESEFLLKLMDSRELYEDNGQFSGNGMAALGLRAQNYDVAMVQAKKYAEEIQKLDKQIANDPYNTTLLDRRKELIGLQRESILAAESEKDAIKDLVSNGINKELESMKTLIDTYTESINEAKSLYDYQKNIEKQAKNVANLRKTLAAYSNDDSEEARARIQKIQVDLAEAEEELAQSEYDQFITDTTKLLDGLYEDYEKILNQRLDDVDGLLIEMMDAANANASNIWTTINEAADSVGYTISDSMSSIWSTEDAMAIRSTISMIETDVNAQIANANANAILTNATILGATSMLNDDASIIDSSIGEVTESLVGDGGISANIETVISDMDTHTETINSTLTSIYDLISRSLNAESSIAPIAVEEVQEVKKASSKAKTATVTPVEVDSNKKTSIDYSSVVATNPMHFESASAMMSYLRNTPGAQAANGDTNVNINVEIERVQDYNDFITQFRNDNQAQKLIQDMTTNQIVGRSTLSKYSNAWK